jgi:rare lipoprotein A (peptidoglycan hydrolase)
VRKTTAVLNARGHPTTASKSLFMVSSNAMVRVYRTATDSSHRTWYLVHVDSRPGWIAGWLTVPVRPATAVRASASTIWHTAYASSYGVGDGLVGHGMACGGVLTTTVMAVANRTLPCGSHVLIRVGSVTVTARVLDRGPYVSGRTFDLGPAVCHALHACYGVTRISWQTTH